MADRCPIRRYRLGVVLLIALQIVPGGAWIAIPPKALAAAGMSESRILQMKQGEVLVDVQKKGDPARAMVEATILIEAPSEDIWRIMINCPEAPTFVPGLKACRVLDSGENWEIIRHEVKWVWFLPRFVYVFRADYQPNRKIDFVRIHGDLRDMKGYWRLIPTDNDSRTIVRYGVFLDPGFFVPQWLVRQALKSDLPAILTSLRTKVLNSRPGH